MFEMQTDSKCSNSYKKTHYQRSKNTQKRSQETQFHTIAKHAWLWNDRLADIGRPHKYHLPITIFLSQIPLLFHNFFSHKFLFSISQIPLEKRSLISTQPVLLTCRVNKTQKIMLEWFCDFFHWGFGAPIAVSKSETYPRTRTKGV